MKFSAVILSAVALTPALVQASCPYLAATAANQASSVATVDEIRRHLLTDAETESYKEAFNKLDLDGVQKDLRDLFLSSDPAWPSDYGNYGPFFIRLAWHCSGSYRAADGRGGCAGGRQRFEPERSWDDNTNLDKARSLLWPVKEKHGEGLSWGDLFTLAGTTAIEAMGGPVLGFCGGRADDLTGEESLPLGPTKEQEVLAPCGVNGECLEPLGSTTVGLIYVNPEGPMGKPDPKGSAPQVRDTFARMGMNDTETVALIGGGHTYGKAHGACPSGPGEAPNVEPVTPWAGECGTGVGADSFTSGFEGAWTVNPTGWDNSYFKNLLDYEWGAAVGPGGHNQWGVVSNGTDSPVSPPVQPHGEPQPLMMLTSDVSLINDAEYKKIVETFAKDGAAFDEAFKHAWYKLVTRDIGPHSRCLGGLTPPRK